MRRAFKWLVKALSVPAVLVTAWVARNGQWADAAPRPVDPALQPRPTQLAPQNNAFFDLLGLEAPQGADINAAGQASLRRDRGDRNVQLRWPKGDAWNCRSIERDCARLWMTQAGAMRAALDAAAVPFEEVLPTRPSGSTRSELPFAALPNRASATTRPASDGSA